MLKMSIVNGEKKMANGSTVKKRKSNIELLRIVCTLMVITLHLLNPSLLGGVTLARKSGSFLNEAIMSWLFCFAICAVDVFILISGFFMISNNKRKLGKAINLMFVCAVYSVVKGVVNHLAAGSAITAKAVLNSLFPKSYYVYIYCALYLVSPYINRAVNGIDKKSYRRLLGVSIVLFSLWPTFIDCMQQQFGWKFTDISFIAADGNGRGFTFVNFVLLYLIGGYIRKYGSESKLLTNKYKCLAIGLGCSVLSLVISLVFPKLWGTNAIIAYDSIIVIVQAAALFNFFRLIDIGSSSVVNFLAKASFGVFLLHMAALRIMREFIDMEAMFTKGTLSAVLCYLVLLLGAYIVSAAVDSLARFVMTPVSTRWSETKLFSFDTGFNETKKAK